jgi:plasmid maintenance system antidote protein VapI
MKHPPKEARSLVDQHVGAKIAHEMASSDLKPSDLSEMLGVTADTIRRYCRGEERVAPDHLIELSRVFEIPVVDFFVWTELPSLH